MSLARPCVNIGPTNTQTHLALALDGRL